MLKSLKAAIVLLGMVAYAPFALAGNAALLELLKALHEQGTLDDATFQSIQTLVVKKDKEDVESKQEIDSKIATIADQQENLKSARKSTGHSSEKAESSHSIKTKGKFEVTSSEGDFKFRVGGRVMVDAAAYDSDIASLGSGTEMRRARLFVAGTMWRVWNYKLQYDFTGSGKGGINDAYLQYAGLDHGSITIGHMKEPFSLQNMTSSKYTTFIERGLPHVFAPGRHIGLLYKTAGENWTAAGGVFGQSIDTPGSDVDEGYAFAGRATYAPIYGNGQTVHLGLGLSHRWVGDNNRLRFRERPESHVTDIRLVDTGSFDADSFSRYGLEAAWIRGPFSFQGEYMMVDVDREFAGNPDVTFDGYYVEAGWFLTGESLNYAPNKGNMSKVTPNANVGYGGIGAWQLALRFSGLDLTDGDITGGEQQDISLGLNWYPNPNLRFSTNYVKVLDVDGGPHAGDEPGAFVVRGQVEF